MAVRRRWELHESFAEEQFPGHTVQFTASRGDAERYAAEAAAGGARLVVAVGGDGTLNEVVNGLHRGRRSTGEVMLGLISHGTGSDFARGAGLPSGLRGGLHALAEATPRRVDLGRLRCRGFDGEEVERFFLNVADFGIGATIAHKVQERGKWLSGRFSYTWQTLRTLVGWRNQRIRFRIDDAPAQERAMKSVLLANGRFAGGGMCVAPAAEFDDGCFELVLLGDLGNWEAARRLRELHARRPIHHPEVSYGRCRRLAAESEETVLVEADGEVPGTLPLQIEILPGALPVVLPAPSPADA